MTQKPDPVDVARAFLQARHPNAQIAFLGGSVAAGMATPTSDLDILIILDDKEPDISYAETTTRDDWLIEAFVHSASAAKRWIQHGRASREPVMDTIAATGIPLTQNPATTRWQQDARSTLDAGGPPLTPAEQNQRRYNLSAALDDLIGSTDPAETATTAWTVFQQAAELTLLLNNQWLGTGKWLIRHLRAQPHDLNRELTEWAASPNHSPSRLVTVTNQVLQNAGGYLQAGHTRGNQPQRQSTNG